MRKRKAEFSGDMDLNMTPMIDIVFQLITFFMVVSEISRIEVDVGIALPHVDLSVLDREAQRDRLTLNVTGRGEIRYFGQALTDRQLRAKLKAESEMNRPGPKLPSNTPIHIRADRGVQFKYIEKILYYCTQDDIRIWKLSFGAAGEKQYDVDPGASK